MVTTSARQQMVDITEQVQAAVAVSGVVSGTCLVYVPHTTCGVAVNEGYDPDVQRDVLLQLTKLAPKDPGFAHAEGNSDSHIKAIMVGASQSLPVRDGRLRLGRWQAVYLCEFDGPRRREVWVSTK
jgi:secondary thiamine-phosphate synthase enzyme